MELVVHETTRPVVRFMLCVRVGAVVVFVFVFGFRPLSKGACLLCNLGLDCDDGSQCVNKQLHLQ